MKLEDITALLYDTDCKLRSSIRFSNLLGLMELTESFYIHIMVYCRKRIQIQIRQCKK